jgi:hypothetical protein
MFKPLPLLATTISQPASVITQKGIMPQASMFNTRLPPQVRSNPPEWETKTKRSPERKDRGGRLNLLKTVRPIEGANLLEIVRPIEGANNLLENSVERSSKRRVSSKLPEIVKYNKISSNHDTTNNWQILVRCLGTQNQRVWGLSLLWIPSGHLQCKSGQYRTQLQHTNCCSSLFHNTKFSDTTIYLGKSKFAFPAHRAVLGICSPYFDDALNSEFKEGKTHEFSYEEDSPHALWRTLQYMYTGDYSDEPSETLDSEGWRFLYPI